MIHVELTVTDVDFDRLAKRFLPELIEQMRADGHPLARLMSGSADTALALLRRLPADAKEKLAVQLLNGRRQELCGLLEQLAAEQDIVLKIRDARVSKQ